MSDTLSSMGVELLVPEPTADTPAMASSAMASQSSAFSDRRREEDRSRSAQKIFKFWRKARLLKSLYELARVSYIIKVQAVVRGFIARRKSKPFYLERLRLLVLAKYAHNRTVRLDQAPIHHRPNLAARRIQGAWRCRKARRELESRRVLASAGSILKAFRSYRFRQFAAKADVRAALRAKMKSAVVKIQALARGVMTRKWIKSQRPAMEAALSEKRPQQLRQQRIAALEEDLQAAKREMEANEIRRVDDELLRQILDLTSSPNKAVLASNSVIQRCGGPVSEGPRGKLKLVEISANEAEGAFVDEAQELQPGPLARVTGKPRLPRAVAPSAVRRKAAEDAAAAKIIRQIRREHAEESATMQYALRRRVDTSPLSAAQR